MKLTKNQQKLLQDVFDYFQKHTKWPKSIPLSVDFRSEGNYEDFVNNIGSNLIQTPDLHIENATTFLWIEGISKCEDSQNLLTDFVKVIRYFAQEYVKRKNNFTILDHELKSRLRIEEKQVKRIIELLKLVGSNFIGAININKFGHNIIPVNRGILNFENIKSIEDYLNITNKRINSGKGVQDKREKMNEKTFGQQNGEKIIKDHKKVFVVYGRNESARKAIFEFLRSIDLKPIEWSEALALTKQSAPYIGNVLDKAFTEAQAVIVLLTGDDLARIGTRYIQQNEYKEELTPQARPNVLFEAGMAFGKYENRTILVQIGNIRKFSDIAGRHIIYLDNSPEKRQELIDRLKTADCDVDISHKIDWIKAGDFEKCIIHPDLDEDKTNRFLTNNNVSKDLENIEIEILKKLAEALNAGRKYLTSPYLSQMLNISMTKVEYYLENLEQNEYIHGSRVIGEKPKYSIITKGKKYLVKNNLI